MDSIILSSQSVSILSQIITDNILITHKLLHSMKINFKGKIKIMAIKLDMFKAYDHVEWSYLKVSMRALGFIDSWIDLVMFCITSVNTLVR